MSDADGYEVASTSSDGLAWSVQLVDANGRQFTRRYTRTAAGAVTFEDRDYTGAVFTPTAPIDAVERVASWEWPLAFFKRTKAKGGFYSAARGVWQDAAMTVPAEANGDPVHVWEDLSGNGNHLISQGATHPTLVVNGRSYSVLGNEPAKAWMLATGVGAVTRHAYCVAGIRGGWSTGDGTLVHFGTGAVNFGSDRADMVRKFNSGTSVSVFYAGVNVQGPSAGASGNLLVESTTSYNSTMIDGHGCGHSRIGRVFAETTMTPGAVQGNEISLFHRSGNTVQYPSAGFAALLVTDQIPSYHERKSIQLWAYRRMCA